MFSAKHVKELKEPSRVSPRSPQTSAKPISKNTGNRYCGGAGQRKTHSSTARFTLAAVLEMIKEIDDCDKSAARDSCKCIIFYPDGIVEQQKQGDDENGAAYADVDKQHNVMPCSAAFRLFGCPSYASSDSRLNICNS